MTGLEKFLAPNRECGSCSVCCVSLRIEDDELQKAADTPCLHIEECGGCSIYAQRPQVCRTWYCGWRIFPGLPNELRPDLSGLLIRVDNIAESRIVLQPLRDYEQVLANEGCVGFIRQVQSDDFDVSLSIPTKPGYDNALVQLPRARMRTNPEGIATVREAVRRGQTGITNRTRPVGDVPTAQTEVSRTAPCPCGSGLRYKHCHGQI
jgi:hypothetical protein